MWTYVSMHGFTPQLSSTARAGPGQSQCQALHLGLPSEWQRPEDLNHLHLAQPWVLQAVWEVMQQTEKKKKESLPCLSAFPIK